MRTWALIFVALLSSDYTRVATGHSGGSYGWSKDCRFHFELTSELDTVLGKIRNKIQSSYDLDDQLLEEYEMTRGTVKGLDNFERRGPYRCKLSKEFIKIYFRIGFIKLVVAYVLSVTDDVLTDLMGGIGSDLFEILGIIVDFFLNILLPDVYVDVVLRHRFGSKGAHLAGFYIYSTDEFTLQNMDISPKSLRPYFEPLLDHVLRHLISDRVQAVFQREFKKVIVGRHMIRYSKGEEYEYYADKSEE